jgi:hypothetical protein
MLVVGRADNVDTFGAQTLRRAVTGCSLGIAAVHLDQLREVDILREGIRGQPSSTSCGRPWSTGLD